MLPAFPLTATKITEFWFFSITELDEEPSLLIENCYEIKEEDTIIPFPKYSAQRDMFLTSDTIMSILDPSPEVLKKYKQE